MIIVHQTVIINNTTIGYVTEDGYYISIGGKIKEVTYQKFDKLIGGGLEELLRAIKYGTRIR